MKSLQFLNLGCCGLRTVPAFVGELESLEVIDLSYNYAQITATLDNFVIDGCPRLRKVVLHKKSYTGPWAPEALAHIEAFKARQLAQNANAEVIYG